MQTQNPFLDEFAKLTSAAMGLAQTAGDEAKAAFRAQAAAKPVFETLQGWSGSTKGARSYAELPAEAVKYIRRIEELVEAPVVLLSTSPERDDTIMMRDPFAG